MKLRIWKHSNDLFFLISGILKSAAQSVKQKQRRWRYVLLTILCRNEVFLKSNLQVGEGEDESSAVVAVEDDEEVEEEAHNVLLPAETIDRKESVELWKSRNETDVIVADHDVFGTDENDEDSLDSLLR